MIPFPAIFRPPSSVRLQPFFHLPTSICSKIDFGSAIVACSVPLVEKRGLRIILAYFLPASRIQTWSCTSRITQPCQCQLSGVRRSAWPLRGWPSLWLECVPSYHGRLNCQLSIVNAAHTYYISVEGIGGLLTSRRPQVLSHSWSATISLKLNPFTLIRNVNNAPRFQTSHIHFASIYSVRLCQSMHVDTD